MPPSRRSLSGRLLVAYAVMVLLVVGLFGLVVERIARGALLSAVEHGLTQEAKLVAGVLPSDVEDVVSFVDELAPELDSRLTIIGPDGSVVADSHADPEAMENHATRPEVRAALEGSVGTDRRVSASTDFEQSYVAVPGPEGRVVRLSLPQSSVDAQLAEFRGSLLVVVGAVAAIGVVVVALVGRRLARPLTQLSEAATTMASGQLDVEVPRSSVEELDRLGRSLSSMAGELGERIAEVDDERRTLEVVLAALGDGTLLVDAAGDILYANPPLADLLGPVPSTVDEVVPFRLQEALREARATGRPVETEAEHGRPVRRLRIVVSPFEDGRALVVVSDITERRKVDDIRRDFVTNASHELKTPVATILAAAETLQIAVDRAPDRVPEFASQIETSARSLARLIGDLLDLSRLEGRTPEYGAVDLEQVVRVEVERIAAMASERGIGITVRSAPARVTGSAPDLSLAVRNLLDNAIRYTDPGGSVTVELEQVEGEVVLRVSDTGAGIPQRDLSRVFERFYRVDEARARATGGTGLGLAIVRHVVESHGGEVGVQSELGAGSTFTVRLAARA